MDANSSNTWSILAILHDASLKISSLTTPSTGRLPTQNSTSHHYEYATNCSRPTKGLTCRLHFAALTAWTTPTIQPRPGLHNKSSVLSSLHLSLQHKTKHQSITQTHANGQQKQKQSYPVHSVGPKPSCSASFQRRKVMFLKSRSGPHSNLYLSENCLMQLHYRTPPCEKSYR